MTKYTSRALLLGPSTVAIHNDSNMLRKVGKYYLFFEITHKGAKLTGFSQIT
jgi:hypothetical protein